MSWIFEKKDFTQKNDNKKIKKNHNEVKDQSVKDCTCQTVNAIIEVSKWQNDKGLARLNYNPVNEAAFNIEEMLEIIKYKGDCKDKSNELTNLYQNVDKSTEFSDEEVAEFIDGHIDSIIFNIGALCKILYSYGVVIPEEQGKHINKLINIVNEYNYQKKSGHINTDTGKLLKQFDYKTPNEEIKKYIISLKK